MKQKVIGAGFALFRASRMHRIAAPLTRGAGVILMFHHVRPAPEPSAGAQRFAPNSFLEITPDFLETVIVTLRAEGLEIVSLDEAVRRTKQSAIAPGEAAPFAALTFDDGYRDNLEHALPVLRRHAAPFTVYAVSGYADGTARLWWRELEQVVARQNRIRFATEAGELVMPCETVEEKLNCYKSLMAIFQKMNLADMLACLDRLSGAADIDGAALVASECMGWDELAILAGDGLCTIGVHTLSHPLLANETAQEVAAQMRDSRQRLCERLNIAGAHFAYPVGGPAAAGRREFAMAGELGFESAVTTRPGMIFPAHAGHLTALPRMSINGNWQNRAAVEILLSGAPFAVWNRGRRVNAA